ncbi:hypothetical protein QTJ16_002371 [Diplocarpon rosae]|uniref:Uncharacterized protein n=1 Tax=Diplocarpon rosae TaxID=946125 RepID=A0AAD9T3R6_9HELO|nr:hypothetical protein QTJ16_002371 [Diplocarpon rosae]
MHIDGATPRVQWTDQRQPQRFNPTPIVEPSRRVQSNAINLTGYNAVPSSI